MSELSSGKQRPTSHDVAREAGLSRTTVSFVLNNTPYQRIPDETRQRVWDAARKLGYTPSAAARALRSGQADVVLFLLPDMPIANTSGSFLEELSMAFEDRGLTLLAHPRSSAKNPGSKLWERTSPTAVIALDRLTAREEEAMRSAGVLTTLGLIWGPRQSPESAEAPDERVGRMQAEHLIAAGHTRLGYAYPDDPRLEYFAEPRLSGAQRACEDAGLKPPQVVKLNFSANSGVEAVQQWAQTPDPPTAICAYNDDHALAVIAGARIVNRSQAMPPRIIGMDDIPAAGLSNPSLTTIAVDLRRHARNVADTVMRRLQGDAAAEWDFDGVLRLIRRQSS